MVYKAKITMFNEELKPFIIDAEGSRTAVVDAVNKIMRDNPKFKNIQVVIRCEDRRKVQ